MHFFKYFSFKIKKYKKYRHIQFHKFSYTIYIHYARYFVHGREIFMLSYKKDMSLKCLWVYKTQNLG